MSSEENIIARSGSVSRSDGLPMQVKSKARKTVFTAGRPPWFGASGDKCRAFVIGITGGSASGKTTVARKIIEELDVPWVCLLSMDSFYKVLSKEESERAYNSEYNFDHPDAFDLELLAETLKNLKDGRQVEVPVYNFNTHSRDPKSFTMYGANVIIFEGILNFCTPALRDLMDVKIFVDEDSDVRLARRLRRDIAERGRDLHGALKQYNKFVKPSFEQHILPTMCFADLVLPRGTQNNVAMDLIIRHVKAQLRNRGLTMRRELHEQCVVHDVMPESFRLVPQTSQLTALHTILRDTHTSRDDFVFYSERVMRSVLEAARACLKYSDVSVQAASGVPYSGRAFTGKVCGVSIVRAGLTLESALRAVIEDATLGKILIQTNSDSLEPELHYLKLPRDIRERHVFLMDATVATGAAAMMAIRVLLDHGVPEENIILVSLIVAPEGVQNVAYAFPRVQIVSSAKDREVSSNYHILPGIGNFGDRYFGTE